MEYHILVELAWLDSWTDCASPFWIDNSFGGHLSQLRNPTDVQSSFSDNVSNPKICQVLLLELTCLNICADLASPFWIHRYYDGN